MPGTDGYEHCHHNARRAIDTEEAGKALLWLFLAVVVLALVVVAGTLRSGLAAHEAGVRAGHAADALFAAHASGRRDARRID